MVLHEDERVIDEQHDQEVVELAVRLLRRVPLQRRQGVTVDRRRLELGPLEGLPEPRLASVAEGLYFLRPVLVGLLKLPREDHWLHGLHVDELHATFSSGVLISTSRFDHGDLAVRVPQGLFLISTSRFEQGDLVVRVPQGILGLSPELVQRLRQAQSMLL